MQALVHCCYAVCLSSWLAASALASEPIVVATGQGPEAPKQPQAAVSTDGTIHLIYGVKNRVYYTSKNGGGEFKKPEVAFEVPNLSLGMRRGPRIALASEAIVVTAIGGEVGMGRDGDLQAWRSIDGGKSWLGPVRVNDDAASAREGLHGMAAGADGSLWCVWLDLRNKRSEVFGAKSPDDGATWEPNISIYRSPDGSVCECCHPSVALDGNKIHVMFRNSIAGNRDMFLVTSPDAGKTFPTAVKLGKGQWKLKACPMDGGMLAASLGAAPVTVWRRDKEIFSAVGAREQLLGRGEQPWVAATSAGPVIAWTTERDGDLLCQTPDAKKPEKIAEAARDPMLAVAVNGSGAAVLCWESKRDKEASIMVKILDAKVASRR